ncbi:hypothetical protein LNQ52_30575 [Klebsiella pneumoniae subsp. pneumoniae]|nr:hypothetical protein [Klebsiella pneumoniae subsp. pneumoniae]
MHLDGLLLKSNGVLNNFLLWLGGYRSSRCEVTTFTPTPGGVHRYRCMPIRLRYMVLPIYRP